MAASPAAIQVQGLSEFRKELKALGKEWPKQLTKVHKEVAKLATDAARSAAAGGTRQQRAAATGLRARATVAGATVGVNAGARTPFANVAFWGMKGRSGWYANEAHKGTPGKPQGPPWIGNTWQVGVAGQGPYAINAAIAKVAPQLLEELGKGVDELTRRAFPDA